MAKSLKKRRRKNDPAQKEKRQKWHADQQEKKISRLKASIALLPEFLDGTNYQLSFSKYNNKLSELHDLTTKSAPSLIKKLSEITRYNSRSIAASNLIRAKVESTGEYKKLYEGLDGDIELVEIQFMGNGGDGRIFCYFVNDHPHGEIRANYCVIVAIKCSHTRI